MQESKTLYVLVILTDTATYSKNENWLRQPCGMVWPGPSIKVHALSAHKRYVRPFLAPRV